MVLWEMVISLNLCIIWLSYIVVGWFLSSQKMACHAQRDVCLSQRPENAGSYAAPRTHQSVSVESCTMSFFHKYVYIKIRKNLSVPYWIRNYILLVLVIPENLRYFIWKAWRKSWQVLLFQKPVTKKMSSDCKKNKRIGMEDRQLYSYLE